MKFFLYFGILLVLFSSWCLYDVATFGSNHGVTSPGKQTPMVGNVQIDTGGGTYTSGGRQDLYVGPNDYVSMAINVPQYITLLTIGIVCIVASLRRNTKVIVRALAVLVLLAVFHYVFVPTVYIHSDNTLSFSKE